MLNDDEEVGISRWLPSFNTEYLIQARGSPKHSWLTLTRYSDRASQSSISEDAARLRLRTKVPGDAFYGFEVRVHRVYTVTWERPTGW